MRRKILRGILLPRKEDTDLGQGFLNSEFWIIFSKINLHLVKLNLDKFFYHLFGLHRPILFVVAVKTSAMMLTHI